MTSPWRKRDKESRDRRLADGQVSRQSVKHCYDCGRDDEPLAQNLRCPACQDLRYYQHEVVEPILKTERKRLKTLNRVAGWTCAMLELLAVVGLIAGQLWTGLVALALMFVALGVAVSMLPRTIKITRLDDAILNVYDL